MACKVTVEKIEVVKRRFAETVFFTVSGEGAAVPRFAKAFHEALTTEEKRPTSLSERISEELSHFPYDENRRRNQTAQGEP